MIFLLNKAHCMFCAKTNEIKGDFSNKVVFDINRMKKCIFLSVNQTNLQLDFI